MDFNRRATTEMTAADIDFVCDTNNGRCMVVHGKPFRNQSTLAAAQCDAATGHITFISESGQRQTVKVALQPGLLKTFLAAREVTVVLTEDGNVNDIRVLPLSAINQ